MDTFTLYITGPELTVVPRCRYCLKIHLKDVVACKHLSGITRSTWPYLNHTLAPSSLYSLWHSL